MPGNEIYDKLTSMTEDLLYISETESEFSIYEVGQGEVNGLMEDVAGSPFATFKEVEHKVFFEKVIAALSADSNMLERKRGFEELFTYLGTTFKNISVFTTEGVEQHIFIVCVSDNGETFLLHTITVET